MWGHGLYMNKISISIALALTHNTDKEWPLYKGKQTVHGLTGVSRQREHQGGGQGEERDGNDQTDHVEETQTLQFYGKRHLRLTPAKRNTCRRRMIQYIGKMRSKNIVFKLSSSSSSSSS